MDVALFSPGKKTGDVVGGRATGFATKAGFGAALTAITGAAVAAVQQIGSISVDPAIKVAALGLIGLGALAWSIAATGDVLARAYASAHVVPGDGGGSPTPVGQWALTTVIREAAKAPGLVAQVLAEAQATSSSRASGEGHLRVTQIARTNVMYQNHEFFALAVRLDPETPASDLSFLIARSGSAAQWVEAKDLLFA